MINQLKSAFITLTRLPSIQIDDEDFDLKNSLWAFPVVGFALAVLLGLAIYLLEFLNIPALAGAVIVVFLLILLTGALHEDGLADFVDSFGASSIERRLEIMRDSQIGTYGSLALIFAVFIRVAALYHFWQQDVMLGVIILSLMTSRGAMIFVPLFSKPARDNGLAASFKDIKTSQIAIAQVLILLVGLFTIGTDVVFILLAGVFVPMFMAKLAERKIGGFTGDVLGATEQVTQIMCFLIFLSLH